MQIGDKVRIIECHKMPELLGEEGEIAGEHSLATSPYPLSVKVAGGLYGFRPEELEPVGDTGIPILA